MLPELSYEVEDAKLKSFVSLFRRLAQDEETNAFLAEVSARPHGAFKTWLVGQATRFVSTYDAHGWLGSYSMHLLSSGHWGELLSGVRRGSLLDVGAGAGYVTAHARPWFERITCTETSRPLARRLKARGFEVRVEDLSETTGPLPESFDVISCLNVLDRARSPIQLLQRLRGLLSPEARFIVAVPLPIRPHVHVAGGTVSPSESLPMSESGFEEALVQMSSFFETQGFVIERIARLPYLSRGDSYAPLYVLDDAVWLLRRG